MRIRTAIFGVYVIASAVGLVAMMGLVLRDVRLRYVESMRRTLGDTAAYMAAFAAPDSSTDDWKQKLSTLPVKTDLLRVFACDREGRVFFDSAARDVGRTYTWPMTGAGPIASEKYTIQNVAVVDGELRVAARVLRGDEFLGWVGVGRPLATVSEGVRVARWRLVIFTGTIAFGMILAGWWIAARLTRSLERLTAYALNIRDGRPTPPPLSRAKEIAELTRAFEQMREALEGRQHVERYTQALAHEVKAPLAAIRGAAELMDEAMPVEQRTKFLANIRGESARIQMIVERLLELSSLEARKTLRQAEAIGVHSLLAEAVQVLQPAYAAADVALSSEGAGEGTLHGERVLLREALVNLLQNALEFSPVGGVVLLQGKVETGRVIFTVDDNGPGIPDYALARVFERFYSLPRPGTGKKSTGLGLALVREIAHLHRGDVQLSNRPEGGARATLWIPLAG